jgi:putative ABC transport system permease protein
MATDSIDYDLYVTVYLSPEDDTNADDLKTCRERAAELVTRVKAIDGIEDMTENKTGLTMNLALEEDRYTDRFRSLLEKAGCTTGDVSFRWNAIDDDTLRRYCETVGVDYDTMTDVDHPAAILINDMVWQNGRTFTDCSALAVSSGDTLPLSYYSYEDEQNHDTSITLAAVTGETVTGISNQTNSQDRTVHLVISQAVYDDYLKLEYSKSNLLDQRTEDTEADMEYTEMSPLYTTLYLKTENPEDVAEELDTIEREMVFREGDNNHVALIVSNEKQQRQTVQQVLFLINTFSYVFIGLISAIGVANIFNTISTSILLRKREFAMLKSVGMTMRSFHKMLLFESLLYGIYSLLWGLPISFGVMGLLYWAMRDTFQMAFLVPWMQVAIGVAAIFLIVLLTVFYAAAKVRREHIMEGLRVRSA